MNRLFSVAPLALLLLAVACARSDGDLKLPGVYRINIQQGNVIEQSMLDRLKPGMEKHQVRFIMGTPTIIDPFHPERWDYVYIYTEGASLRQERHLTLYFENEKLAYLEGDVQTSLRKPPDNFGKKSKIVVVPDNQYRKIGLLDNIKKVIPFIGDKEPPPPPDTDTNTETNTQDQKEAPVEQKEQTQSEKTDQSATEQQQQPEQKGFFRRMLDKLPGKGGNEDKKDADTGK